MHSRPLPVTPQLLVDQGMVKPGLYRLNDGVPAVTAHAVGGEVGRDGVDFAGFA